MNNISAGFYHLSQIANIELTRDEEGPMAMVTLKEGCSALSELPSGLTNDWLYVHPSGRHWMGDDYSRSDYLDLIDYFEKNFKNKTEETEKLTTSNLLAVKKMAYRALLTSPRGRRSFYSDYSRGGSSSRGRDGELDEILGEINKQNELLKNQFKISALLAEIDYIERNIDKPFNTVSFMMSDDEERSMKCID